MVSDYTNPQLRAMTKPGSCLDTINVREACCASLGACALCVVIRTGQAWDWASHLKCYGCTLRSSCLEAHASPQVLNQTGELSSSKYFLKSSLKQP